MAEENKTLYTKTCERCGKEFGTNWKRQHFCNKCKANPYIRKPQNEPKKIEKFHRTLPGTIPIRAYVAKIEKYNREHGTSYTYGQFENLVHSGKIKIERCN